MLVVTAIIVVITTIVLANNNQFGGRVQLEDLAYNVALSIRQAQVYGISVQRFQSGTFNTGYGVHFDLSSPSAYVLFADAISPNGLYDCPQPGTQNCELVQTTTISQGYALHDLCMSDATGVETCGIAKLDVVFERPEPDAWVSGNGVSCVLDHSTCASAARIVLISPRSDTMSVSVQANGQISVGK